MVNHTNFGNYSKKQLALWYFSQIVILVPRAFLQNITQIMHTHEFIIKVLLVFRHARVKSYNRFEAAAAFTDILNPKYFIFGFQGRRKFRNYKTDDKIFYILFKHSRMLILCGLFR